MMAERMIVHDKRLDGRSPHIAQNIYEVDENVDIQHCVGWVGQHARDAGGLSELMIMCHGYEADWDQADQMCTGRPVGGFGLQLCKEGLSLSNVILTQSWNADKPLIKRITVYACAPADTGPGNAGTADDGRRFMGELALWSGAEVIAARDTQRYSPGGRFFGRIDFGAWEGPVYRFDPGTGNPSLYNPGPMR
jgi:hypothetical protein